ncbi:MAG: hypothetical protein A2902_04825 [Elusimicrobia bacterium RIFCSPLOWO2_01_FULL_64_13]|nr:MAG: hypothetical protein A2636_06560 [Elusimicrobia bacterium RIFCSPHIGHO2_01_FULL_64_10]OGR95252.1 MAG: hypothetical protein A2902_04825 [Elusimicrobia bacterium RIFCSPLOWO2_01_FULL_64_13]
MIKFLLHRNVIINLLTAFFVIVGGTLFVTVRREAFPEVTFDMVTVTTIYPAASPEDVERLVTNPIEDELRAIDEIDKLESYSLEGRSFILARLDEELSDGRVSRVVSDIQQAVARVKDLPDEAEDPLVEEMTSDRPLITVSVAGADPATRDGFAEEFEDALEDVPGVSRVVGTGDSPKEIWVEASLDKLLEHRVTLGEVARILRERNLNLSAGTAPDRTRELMVRTVGELETAKDVSGVILRGNDERSFLRVRNVAAVRETFEDEKLEPRANGKPAIHLQVFKKKKGDTIHIAERVKALRREMEPSARALGLELIESDDISYFITRRLKVMRNNMMIGGVFILVALFLFVDWRVAVAAAWGVPLAFLAAMTIAIPLGFTLNLLTLLALIIVLGMLNDDAVVVAENIQNHMERGEPPDEAAYRGTKEVILPVLGAVTTTMAAFVPFGMVSGIMGKFIFMIPVTVILCLLASMLEAFWVLPSHALGLMRLGGKARQDAGLWFQAVVKYYRRSLNWCIDHRYKFMAFAVILGAVTILIGMARIKIVMFPEGLIDQFFVQIETPRGTSLETTKEALDKVEKVLLTLPKSELEEITGTVGLTGYEEGVRRGTHLAQERVFLTPQESRERRTDEILAWLRPQLERIPGIAKLTVEKLRPGPPTGRAVQVRVRGRDLEVLKKISEEIQEELARLPGTFDIRDSLEGGKDEVQVRLNPEEAAYSGLDATRIARELLFAFDGSEATEIQRGDDEIKVRVKLRPEDERRPDLIERLRVLNPQGREIRLGSAVQTSRRGGPAYIEHYNFRRSLTVFADVDNVRLTSYQANQALAEKFKGLSKERPGYELIFGGEEEHTRESMLSLRRGLIVALLLNFVILAGLFSSYVQPFIIMQTIPIGLVGVAWALIVHREPASFMALLGTVAMTGVVVNNAVLLVDFINHERAKGVSLREAVVEAGVRRLRPIWASSITTLVALFPTAYGWGGKEPFVQPMSLALAWGLAFATPITMFFIPMFYLVLDETMRWARGRMARLLGRAPKDGGPAV